MDKIPVPNNQILNCTNFLRTYGYSLLTEEDESRTLFHNTSIDNKTIDGEYAIEFSDPVFVLKAVGLGLMIILTIFGNMLVIASVLPSPTLRTPTHSLIVNLAVADLLLGEFFRINLCFKLP